MFEVQYFTDCTLREFKERAQKVNEEAWMYAEALENTSDYPQKDKKNSFHFPHRHHHHRHHVRHAVH